MSKLNYSRPNGGYTRFRTAKELPDATPIGRAQRLARATIKRNLRIKQQQINRSPMEIHGCHPARVLCGNQRYVLWCDKCKCEIQQLSAEEYQIWRELNPPRIQKATK